MTGTSNSLIHSHWNDSLKGEYLWSDANFGEAVTEVMTPLSWTVLKLIFGQWVVHPQYDTVGNIGGRPYLNISLFASVLEALGRSRQQTLEFLEGTLYMKLPEAFEIPTIAVARSSVPSIFLGMGRMRLREWRGAMSLAGYLDLNPARCRQLREGIRQTAERGELVGLWWAQILPHAIAGVWHVMGTVNFTVSQTMRLRRNLETLVGRDDAHLLTSNLSSSSGQGDGSGMLASLGPVVGIARLARGEMEPEAYLEQYGHRGPHEFELSVARPAEDPEWLNRELDRFRADPVDVEGMLAQQRAGFESAWARFERSYPRRARPMGRQITRAARWARQRELARSEYVRDRWLIRAFALRAGELTGLGDDIFFLPLHELLAVLSGDEAPLASIPTQREIYARYKALPPYPSLIVGHFDPLRWSDSPEWPTDLYDARLPQEAAGSLTERGDLVTGSPGSAGQVEGLVRRLDRPEEGDQMQAGEVLVTKQTDISWTLLFPRAAAVVTDVGAPLSHAAIVARELGIPAVVGCGDATMRLQTGDRVRVNGAQGTVEVLEPFATLHG